MNTSLSHLPPVRRQQLRTITELINRSVRPEKIILFGIHADPAAGPLLQTGNPARGNGVGYDILIITRQDDRHYDYELQDLIENRCHGRTAVTILVHDIVHVNKSLTEGHRFFYQVISEGILLHDSEKTALAKPATPDFACIAETAKRDFARLSRQARVFLDSALFNQQRCENNISIFLLHQAAENAYQAILLVFTGYKPCTHNLDKLRRYTNRLSIELAALFPRDNPEEDGLFKLLLGAYVGARYDPQYKITDEQLLLLLQRILRLQYTGERICRNQFKLLDRRVGEPVH